MAEALGSTTNLDPKLIGDRAPEKGALECEKLLLEIAELKRPWFRRPATYFNAAVVASAFLGVVGSFTLSFVKSERALLLADQAKAQVMEADRSLSEAYQAERVAREEEVKAKGRASQLRDEIKILEKKFSNILTTEEEKSAAKIIARESIERRLKRVIAQQLDIDTSAVTSETKIFEDLGANPLDIVELLMAIEVEFNIEIPDEIAERLRTTVDITNYVIANS